MLKFEVYIYTQYLTIIIKKRNFSIFFSPALYNYANEILTLKTNLKKVTY